MQQAVIARVGEERSFLGPLAAGVAAGLASSIVRVPTEVVKTRMQTGGWAGGRAWRWAAAGLVSWAAACFFAGISSRSTGWLCLALDWVPLVGAFWLGSFGNAEGWLAAERSCLQGPAPTKAH